MKAADVGAASTSTRRLVRPLRWRRRARGPGRTPTTSPPKKTAPSIFVKAANQGGLLQEQYASVRDARESQIAPNLASLRYVIQKRADVLPGRLSMDPSGGVRGPIPLAISCGRMVSCQG